MLSSLQEFSGTTEESCETGPEGRRVCSIAMPRITAELGREGLPVSFTCGENAMQTKLCSRELPPMLWLWPLAPVADPLAYVRIKHILLPHPSFACVLYLTFTRSYCKTCTACSSPRRPRSPTIFSMKCKGTTHSFSARFCCPHVLDVLHF